MARTTRTPKPAETGTETSTETSTDPAAELAAGPATDLPNSDPTEAPASDPAATTPEEGEAPAETASAASPDDTFVPLGDDGERWDSLDDPATEPAEVLPVDVALASDGPPVAPAEPVDPTAVTLPQAAALRTDGNSRPSTADLTPPVVDDITTRLPHGDGDEAGDIIVSPASTIGATTIVNAANLPGPGDSSPKPDGPDLVREQSTAPVDVPADVQDNYRNIHREQGREWSVMADDIERAGDSRLATWMRQQGNKEQAARARAEAAAAGDPDGRRSTDDQAPAGRRSSAHETA